MRSHAIHRPACVEVIVRQCPHPFYENKVVQYIYILYWKVPYFPRMGKALYLPFESVVLSKSFVMEGHYLNFTVKSTDPLHAGYIERKLLFMYFYFKESRENIFL